MNYGDMFNMLGPSSMDDNFSNNYSPTPYEPRYTDPAPISNWEEAFSGFKSTPVLYNMDGFISPYASNNWGGTTNILQYINDESRLPQFENKIDPNKIFSSEINGLRALAADQQRITKMFETRLRESLSEKGKMGLTEEDIEAMSALTAARSAITSTYKEQVAIKKNIADIRIKQAQNSNANTSASADGGVSSNGRYGTVDVGRNILDNIFNLPSTAPSTSSMNAPYTPAPPTDVDTAARVLDDLVPTTNDVVKYEGYNPTTYVVVGEGGSVEDADFITLSSTNEVIQDFPKPTTRITDIDMTAKTAKDELGVEYPIYTNE